MARALPQGAGGVLSYFVRHKTLANLLLVIMLVAGLVAMPKMRAQFFPDVILDTVSVSVAWDGAGAEDVDAAIVQVLEPALLSVEGVDSSSASSSEGRAIISLEFEPNWDMARAADDVQAAVDQVSGLPDEAEDPVVRRGQWRDRVTDIVITGPVGVAQLALFADELTTRLFAEGLTSPLRLHPRWMRIPPVMCLAALRVYARVLKNERLSRLRKSFCGPMMMDPNCGSVMLRSCAKRVWTAISGSMWPTIQR
jgi:hypothetical protein